MLGAAVVSRITRRSVGEVKLPTSSIAVLVAGTMLTLALSALWIAVDALGGPAMIITTGVLTLVLGAQAAAVKHVGIRDLSTVVVTMTMVNLSTDSRLAGGNGASGLRRVGAVAMMGLGALASAVVTLQLGGAYTVRVDRSPLLDGQSPLPPPQLAPPSRTV